jgi:hypothetical protein
LARLALVLMMLVLPGCAVFGGAGSATLGDGRIDARGSGAAAGIGASGPYVGATSGRVIVR